MCKFYKIIYDETNFYYLCGDNFIFRSKEEYDNVVQELVLAEREENERQRELEAFEKKLRTKLELQRNHAIQMQYLEDRRAAEAAELEAYRQ